MPIPHDEEVPDFRARLELRSRNFVVVGAGAGMGRQVAHALAQAGAGRIVCVDLIEKRAKEVAEEIGIGVPVVADVTMRSEVASIGEKAVGALGEIHGLVNVVGMSLHQGPLAEMKEADWDANFALNLKPALFLLQEFGPRISEAGGGSVVLIGSVSGNRSITDQGAYGSAKAALAQLAKSFAAELGHLGVRVNVVLPGHVLTPRLVESLGVEGYSRPVIDAAPLARIGEPSDIAGAVLFLSSDLASYITGETLTVDGGLAVVYPIRGSFRPERS
jgi:NAD(P)-dependent dehydrogenase (short-subunit alcohol dehydrogenase family)